MRFSLGILLVACLWADGAQAQSGFSQDYFSPPPRVPGDQTPCDNWPKGTSLLLRVGARARLASAVFVGQVIGDPSVKCLGGALYEGDSIRWTKVMNVPPDTTVTAQLRVLKSWKCAQVGKVISVRTGPETADGVPFRRGHKYLVYAMDYDNDNSFESGLCDRSRELRFAREDMTILDGLVLEGCGPFGKKQ